MHGHCHGGEVKHLKREVRKLNRKVEKQTEEMGKLKAQMKSADLVARVEALEDVLEPGD